MGASLFTVIDIKKTMKIKTVVILWGVVLFALMAYTAIQTGDGVHDPFSQTLAGAWFWGGLIVSIGVFFFRKNKIPNKK